MIMPEEFSLCSFSDPRDNRWLVSVGETIAYLVQLNANGKHICSCTKGAISKCQHIEFVAEHVLRSKKS